MIGNDEKDAGVPNQRMPVDGDDAAMDCAAIEDEMIDDYIASVVTEAVHVLIPDEDLEALLLEAKSKAVADTLADAKDSTCGNLSSAALGIAWAGDSGRPMETVSLSSSMDSSNSCKESPYLTLEILPSTPHGSDDAKQKKAPTKPRRLKRLIFLGASTGASAGTLVSAAALLPRAQEALRGPASIILLASSAILLALGISTALVYHRAVQATSLAYQQGSAAATGNSETNRRSRNGLACRMHKNERATASA
ncbi:hypothetical protein ACNAW0_18895 [Micromonospora sp. SL1-18]|uniref:hypothetical protein n=1 Tax=Micromonospora sp. SL1-18 TaxID=3399128 RepID=UPI003A4D8B59